MFYVATSSNTQAAGSDDVGRRDGLSHDVGHRISYSRWPPTRRTLGRWAIGGVPGRPCLRLNAERDSRATGTSGGACAQSRDGNVSAVRLASPKRQTEANDCVLAQALGQCFLTDKCTPEPRDGRGPWSATRTPVGPGPSGRPGDGARPYCGPIRT